MADPRGNVRNIGVGVQFMAVALDSSITLPITANNPVTGAVGPFPSVSPDVGKAVTWSSLSNSTYASDSISYAVGLGSNGDPFIGTLVRVDPDGKGTIAYKGVVEVLANQSNAPLENGLVAVDGTGRVVASTAAKCANARCLGFAPSANQAVYVHPQGTITPPTTNQQAGSVEYCQVMLS